MAHVRCTCLLILLAACQGDSAAPVPPIEPWVRTIVLADPLFGGGATFARRVLGDLTHRPTGDPLRRLAFLDEQCAQADREASAAVTELVPREIAAEVCAFLASKAGNAQMWAETTALTLYALHGDEFAAEAARRFGDENAVGEAARRRLVAAVQARAQGESVSPPLLAFEVAAQYVTPELARDIAAFRQGPAGTRWLQARSAAFPRTTRRFAELGRALQAGGFWELQDERDGEELILPKARGR